MRFTKLQNLYRVSPPLWGAFEFAIEAVMEVSTLIPTDLDSINLSQGSRGIFCGLPLTDIGELPYKTIFPTRSRERNDR